MAGHLKPCVSLPSTVRHTVRGRDTVSHIVRGRDTVSHTVRGRHTVSQSEAESEKSGAQSVSQTHKHTHTVRSRHTVRHTVRGHSESVFASRISWQFAPAIGDVII